MKRRRRKVRWGRRGGRRGQTLTSASGCTNSAVGAYRASLRERPDFELRTLLSLIHDYQNGWRRLWTMTRSTRTRTLSRMIVRSCELLDVLHRLTLHICQLLPCCSLVKRAMANILTSMLTTRHTTISSTLASGLPTCNISTSSLLLSRNLFTLSCLRNAGFIETTSCTCIFQSGCVSSAKPLMSQVHSRSPCIPHLFHQAVTAPRRR